MKLGSCLTQWWYFFLAYIVENLSKCSALDDAAIHDGLEVCIVVTLHGWRGSSERRCLALLSPMSDVTRPRCINVWFWTSFAPRAFLNYLEP